MAELHFFTGTMDSGKSTLALQTNHNHAARGRVGRIFATHDRAGEATISSRLGLQHDAIEVEPGFNFWNYVVDTLTQGGRIDYLICDEAQFFTADQGIVTSQLATLPRCQAGVGSALVDTAMSSFVSDGPKTEQA